MEKHTYLTIGIYLAIVAYSIWLVPLAYLITLKAKNFISDTHYDEFEKGSPIERVNNKFKIYDDSRTLIEFSLVGAIGALISIFVWPLLVAAIVIIITLLALRMSSRLQRHMSSKDAHK